MSIFTDYTQLSATFTDKTNVISLFGDSSASTDQLWDYDRLWDSANFWDGPNSMFFNFTDQISV